MKTTARWHKNRKHYPKWVEATDWYIDPLNTYGTASDKNNVGTTSDKPLQTIQEWARRLDMLRFGTTIPTTVHLMSAIPATDVIRVPTAIDEEPGDGNVFPVVFKGVRTTVASGTTGSGCTITSGNTQAIFDGGLDSNGNAFVAANYVGRRVVITSTGATAVITKDLGGALAQVSDWVTVSQDTLPSPTTTLVSAPGSSLAYTIVDGTAVSAEFMSVGSPLIRYRFVDLDFQTSALAEALTFRNLSFSFITCRLRRKLGLASGASGGLNACGIDFAALTTLTAQENTVVSFTSCGLRNVELVPFADGKIVATDSHIEGGYVRVGCAANSTRAFGGTAGTTLHQGFFNVTGTRGFGVFNAPTGRAGVSLRRWGVANINGALYGSGNATFGVDVSEGGKMGILSTVTPTITGGTQDLQLDGRDTHMPDLFASAGGSLPAASSLTTWAHYTGSPFSRNVVSTKTGAAIISIGTT